MDLIPERGWSIHAIDISRFPLAEAGRDWLWEAEHGTAGAVSFHLLSPRGEALSEKQAAAIELLSSWAEENEKEQCETLRDLKQALNEGRRSPSIQQSKGAKPIIATTNVGHLSRLGDAREWSAIP